MNCARVKANLSSVNEEDILPLSTCYDVYHLCYRPDVMQLNTSMVESLFLGS